MDDTQKIAMFEEKVALSPRVLNELRSNTKSLDDLILSALREKLEGKCHHHGYVVPDSIKLLSRSMGILENGRFTGNILFYVQAQGMVYNPANGTKVVATVLKKNKMGLYVIYKDAIRIVVPRDLHLKNSAYETIVPGNEISIQICLSRFQVNDPFIMSVGILDGTDMQNVANPVDEMVDDEENKNSANAYHEEKMVENEEESDDDDDLDA
jgi:DNA-directed RNA polymerase subunit E'/Rpb7